MAKNLLAGCLPPRACVVVLSAVCGVSGCQKQDLGKFCGTDVTPVSEEPVGGERPAVEVVRVERDVNCESFQCLRHLGLPAYCTRECRRGAGEGPCTRDSDCESPATCFAGACAADGCGAGFWCRPVQEAGPLRDKNFCSRRTGCDPADPFECGDLGKIECKTFGCYDSCLDVSDENCVFHQLVCPPVAELPCTCGGSSASADLDCPDAELQCANTFRQFPPESIVRLNVCESTVPIE